MSKLCQQNRCQTVDSPNFLSVNYIHVVVRGDASLEDVVADELDDPGGVDEVSVALVDEVSLEERGVDGVAGRLDGRRERGEEVRGVRGDSRERWRAAG